MTDFKYRYATFCQISGEVTLGNKHYWLCSKHGEIQIVPYYGFSTALCVWACPECLEEHLDCKIKVAKDARVCSKCVSTMGLEDCELCGKPACLNHRVRMVCDTCVTDAGLEGFNFYNG